MKNKTEKFIEYITNRANLDRCPFLATWVEEKLEKFLKVPIKPSREGIPRGEPVPMSGPKLLMALDLTICPDMSLKEFAEATSGVSYAVVRQWMIQHAFNDFLSDFLDEYTILFCERLEHLCKSDEPIERVHLHLNELQYYKNILIFAGISGKLNKLIEDAQSTAIDSYYLMRLAEALRYKMLVISSKNSIFANAQLHREAVKSSYIGLQQYLSFYLDILTTVIKNGKTEGLLSVVNDAKDFAENIMSDFIECKMELYDLKHKKGKRNPRAKNERKSKT